jgi:exopolyphosphatase/guanosine-5'-triphosphate,3'-diphosphate pyrophosphatase
MISTRRAVIDIGTNSVKLLVAEVAGRDVRPVLELARQTRLGGDFYDTHRLQPQAIAKTAEAVAAFAAAARAQEASSIRVIATSAARDAGNSDELATAIARASDLRVEIISGEQEAEWAFRGVTTDAELASRPLLVLDVGGGSTEFILGSGGHARFRRSYLLGTVRLMERLPHSDPPTPEELGLCRKRLRDFLDRDVRPDLIPALHREVKKDSQERGTCTADHETVQLVGTGGTTSILAAMEAGLERFDRAHIEATRLRLERVRAQMQRLWESPLAERKKFVGLPPDRADVILYGVAIYEAVMEQFSFAVLRASTRGLRFAAVMEGV